MSLDSLCRWQVQVSVYWRIPAHLRCTQCSILLHLMDICFLTCICLQWCASSEPILQTQFAIALPSIPIRLGIHAIRGGVVILDETSRISRIILILSLGWCCTRACRPDFESLNTTQGRGTGSHAVVQHGLMCALLA